MLHATFYTTLPVTAKLIPQFLPVFLWAAYKERWTCVWVIGPICLGQPLPLHLVDIKGKMALSRQPMKAAWNPPRRFGFTSRIARLINSLENATSSWGLGAITLADFIFLEI